jgi:hypothetical protein
LGRTVVSEERRKIPEDGFLQVSLSPVYFTALSISRLYIAPTGMIIDIEIGKYLKGSGRSIPQVLYRNLRGGTEETRNFGFIGN